MKNVEPFVADDLLILAKVIELRSISAAASALAMPRSTVSRRISQLESSLGLKLLRKNTRQISVTDLGYELYQHAQNIQLELDRVRAILGGRQQEPQGVLRVAMPVFMGVDFASRVGATFLQSYPKARLEMRFVSGSMHPIKDGYDVTLAYGPLQDSTLIGQKLFSIESLLCAAPKFIATLPQPISQPAQLAELPFIDAGQDSGTFRLQLRQGKKTFELAPPVRAQANNFQVGKHYVAQGIGIGALPRHLCLSELAEGTLVPLLDNWRLETRDVYVVYPFQLSYSNLIKAFYDTAYDTMRRITEENHSAYLRVLAPVK